MTELWDIDAMEQLWRDALAIRRRRPPMRTVDLPGVTDAGDGCPVAP